jgi:hypothetical protein
MRALRKLVLGETWALPAGVAVALLVAVAIRALAGPHGWWHSAGGWVLFGLLAGALALALRPGRL